MVSCYEESRKKGTHVYTQTFFRYVFVIFAEWCRQRVRIMTNSKNLNRILNVRSKVVVREHLGCLLGVAPDS